MKDQQRREMQWYSQRLALKQAQSTRADSSAQAQAILRSLSGASGVTTSAQSSPLDNEAELAALDRKIYAAQQDMETAMTLELKSLGVPFFGTNPALVVANDEELHGDNGASDRPKWSPLVTAEKLLELRRKMVAHLEDLYRD